MSRSTPPEGPDVRETGEVPAMFDRIAGHYDPLNRLLSMRRDVAWRRRLLRGIAEGDSCRLLDVATGTGDVLIEWRRTRPGAAAVGIDASLGMLTVARAKLGRAEVKGCLLAQGDALGLPLPSDTFDAATMAFGIRNVGDVPAALRELLRVLKPGGRARVMEFSLPGNPVLRWAYLFYLRHVMPTLGGALSGEPGAYRYLNRSIEAFPRGDAFCALMRDAGFDGVKAAPLTFEIVSLYEGTKPGG